MLRKLRNGWIDDTTPGTGLRRTLRIDPETNKMVMKTEQEDMEMVLRMNSAFLNAERPSTSLWAGRSAVRVASIPLEAVLGLRKKGIDIYKGANDTDATRHLMRILSSNEYSKWRTAPGRLA